MGGEVFYGFSLFINNEEIGFNFNLPRLTEENCTKIFRLLNCEPFPFFPIAYSIEKIFQVLKCKPFKLFPLHYETDVRSEDGTIISGTFDVVDPTTQQKQ